MIKLRTLIVVATVVVVGCVLWCYHMARLQYSAWLSERQQCLRFVGERLMAYSRIHSGTLPAGADGLVQAGLLAESELEFQEPVLGVSVLREYRRGAAVADGNPVILIVETYVDRGFGESNVLFSNGHVTCYGTREELETVLQKDNRRRTETRVDSPP